MAALDYSVDTIVARVRRTCQIATDDQKLSTSEIIQICDEEIQQNLSPRLLALSDGYQEIASAISLTSGVKAYRLPFAASSSTIRRVNIIQITGGADNYSACELSRVDASRIPEFVGTNQNTPTCYALSGDTIVMLPTPDSNAATNYAIQVMHTWRPARLAPNADGISIVSAVAAAAPNMTITVSSATLPTGWVIGTTVDIVPSQPPLAPIALGGSLVTVAGAPVLTVFGGYSLTAAEIVSQIGSTLTPWLVPTGYTTIFPLPDAWWSAAILACSASVCRIIGDNAGADALRADSENAINRLVLLQANRAKDQPLPVFNRYSPLRRMRAGYWGTTFNGSGS